MILEFIDNIILFFWQASSMKLYFFQEVIIIFLFTQFVALDGHELWYILGHHRSLDLEFYKPHNYKYGESSVYA